MIIVVAVVIGVVVGLVAAQYARGAPPMDRNHLNMARLLERLLRDDMIRPMLPVTEQREALELLTAFWGDPPPGLPEPPKK